MDEQLQKKLVNKEQNKKKEKKLSTEISRVVSCVLAVIFIIMIGTAILLSGMSITTAITGEFMTASTAADSMVESILNSASSATDNITDYLQKAYKYSDEGRRNMSGDSKVQSAGSDSAVFKSSIYNEPITEMSSDVEKYITQIVRQTAKNNADIVGMSVLFEPYAFDSNISDYGFYVLGEESEKEITPFGLYADYSKEEYYSKTAASKKPEFTEPYDDQGIKMVTYSVPIVYENELKGVITADINVTNFAKIYQANENYPSQYTTVLNENGVVVYDSESEDSVGAALEDFIAPKYLTVIKDKMKGDEQFSIDIRRADGVKESCFYSPIKCGDIKWWVLTALNTSDKNRAVTLTFIILLAMMIAGLVLVTWIVFYLLRKMLKPIDSVVSAAESIAQGNLNIEINSESEDEIGRLANAFMQTVNVLKSIIEDEAYLLKEMADGNFDIESKAENNYKGDFAPILKSLKGINTKLSDTLGQIGEASNQVSSASNQMAETAQSLAEGSTEQASSVQELLATINEVAAQVDKNASDAADVSNRADNVVGFANESNKQMNEMTEAMGRISEAAKQIGEIISAIESIASQTNLLSLNAAIEAASAGEAGKGFAVVAEEIRQLASQSSKAANNTRMLIETSIKEVENGNRIADITAKSLEKVTAGIGDITQIADAVKDSSEKQATSMEEVTNGIEQISEVVQSNSAAAEESSATSEELSAQADELKNLVGRFILKK